MVTPRPERSSPRLVSVVVPVRNGAATIAEQLHALAGQEYPGAWEVLVADNGSSDATVTIVEAWRARLPGLRIVDASGAAGPGRARNCGAQHAAGDFLAFCDADDVVAREWLAALVAEAPRFDIVTGPLDGTAINTAAVASSRPPRAAGIPSSGRFLPFAPSGNLGVWADVFSRTGGFDDAYAQCEDVEWSWRAQLDERGTIGFAPDAVVRYRYRSEPAAIARQAFGRGFASARLYRDYRARGMKRPSPLDAARTWLWLVVRIGALASPARRGTWIRRFSEAAGRFWGSVRHRVVFL